MAIKKIVCGWVSLLLSGIMLYPKDTPVPWMSLIVFSVSTLVCLAATLKIVSVFRSSKIANRLKYVLGIYCLGSPLLLWWSWPLPFFPLVIYLHSAVFVYHIAYAFPLIHYRWMRISLLYIGHLTHAAVVIMIVLFPLILLVSTVTLVSPSWLLTLGPLLATMACVQETWASSTERHRVSMFFPADSSQVLRCKYPQSIPVSSAREKISPQNRSLTIFQISDPHMGLMVTSERLRRLCMHAVDSNPDLVLVTGDLLAVEAVRDDNTEAALRNAFLPLTQLKGRCFACMGNHDYDALPLIQRVFAECGITLLMDTNHRLNYKGISLDIVGAHYAFAHTDRATQKLCDLFPGINADLRIWLIHDPRAFESIPRNEGVLVFSGHFHGGIIGALSFGLDWTACWNLFQLPDYGWWVNGKNRMYLHRGSGQSSFPIRLGISRETSVVSVDF